MLSAHPGLDCGPESRFFYGLRPKELAAVLADPAWPARAVRAISGLVTAQQSVLTAFDVTAEDVRAYLAARPPSVPALLESLTVPHAQRAGKPRWVEKSTDHLVRTTEIRAAWPDAPIIRIVRDPRTCPFAARNPLWARILPGQPRVLAQAGRRQLAFLRAGPRLADGALRGPAARSACRAGACLRPHRRAVRPRDAGGSRASRGDDQGARRALQGRRRPGAWTPHASRSGGGS